MTQPSPPFITVEDITVRLGERLILENSSWRIGSDEHWAILGPNGSGKSTLVRSLFGGVPLRGGRVLYHFGGAGSSPHAVPPRGAVGYVSFELQQQLMEQEAFDEELREYAGRKDGVTTCRDVVLSAVLAVGEAPADKVDRLAEVADLLDLHPLLDRSITALSTGEMRKTLIARALMKSPRLLILDEPFDGLDEPSRESLAAAVNTLMFGSMRVVLIVHRIEEVVPNITHALFVKEGRILLQGPKDEMITSDNLGLLYGGALHVEKRRGKFYLTYGMARRKRIDSSVLSRELSHDTPETLIEMRETTVTYGETIALGRLNWTVRKGEHWAILGPNGSGKSTLLRLILGENLQAYANDITLFGRRKGSGETLWEIRQKIGVVSSELQVQYRKKMTAYDVMASGFYDSIGLYQYPTHEEKAVVDRWVEMLTIEDIARRRYHQLSYGQQRMILLARAMIKPPVLLIIDEPCHGLDIPNRRRILEIIEIIGGTRTQILYVTHHIQEIPACITHVLRLEQGRVISQGLRGEVLKEASEGEMEGRRV
jgi:molybdate transport system ATP-binding protein